MTGTIIPILALAFFWEKVQMWMRFMKTPKALSKITFTKCLKCGCNEYNPSADGSKLKCSKCGHIVDNPKGRKKPI